MHCKLNFEIDGTNYFIEKKGKKNLRSGHVKVDIDFWMVDENGDTTSLNGDQRRTTQLNIRKVVGDFEDFVLTSMSSQNDSTVFINKTQKERKELLSQFMGLKIFDRLWVQASNDIKDVNALLTDFKKADYDSELAQITNELITLESKEKTLKSQEENIKVEIKEYQEKIERETKNLKPVDQSIRDIEVLKDDKSKIEVQHNDILKNIDNAITEQYDCERLINDTEQKIQTYENDNVQEKFAQLEKLEQERDLFQIEVDKLKADVKIKLDKIEKLGNLTWDEDCEHCMSNPFTLDAIETKKHLDKDKELATKYLTTKSRMDDKIQTMFKVRAYKQDLDKLGQSLVEGNTRHSQLTSNLQYLNEREENIQNQINSIVSEMDRYVAQEKDVVFNQSIDLRIQDLKSEQYLLDDKLEDTKLASTNIFGNIQDLKNKEKQINENIDKVEKLEGDYQAYQYLLNAIQRDGVPYDLISKSLPTVEGAVNDILAQIVDFSVVFSMNGKDIDTHIVYDDDRVWSLELSSGMERFISSLAIRIGLMNVSNLPQGNFLAIDEGWGTMDSDNLNSVAQLFQYLKSQFQFTFVVSHIETMRDFVDTLLEIKKVDGSSSVRFSR